MINKNSNFCIEKIRDNASFLFPFLPILVIYSAFLSANFEDL